MSRDKGDFRGKDAFCAAEGLARFPFAGVVADRGGSLAGGEKLRLSAEKKFNALSDGVFLTWRKRGWIAAVVWHFAAMDNLRRLVERAGYVRAFA